MLKNFKPIIVIAGDPKSIFLEIYFKSVNKIKSNKPLILVVNKKILLEQMNALKYKFKINELDVNNLNFKNLSKKEINIIHVPYDKKYISKYIYDSFEKALSIIKKNKGANLINGPINKKKF